MNNEYDIGSIARNGQILLADLHFNEEMELLDVRLWHLSKRQYLIREFKALYIALWHIALKRSFPESYSLIYDYFLVMKWSWVKNESEKSEMQTQAHLYYDKLHERGIEDFTEISRHILSLTDFNPEQTKSYILKLSLHIRSIYNYLFEHLV